MPKNKEQSSKQVESAGASFQFSSLVTGQLARSENSRLGLAKENYHCDDCRPRVPAKRV